MKKFLLFSGCQYYPRGGWMDFKRDFDTSQEATDFLHSEEFRKDYGVADWWHVINLTTGRIVALG